MNEKEKVKIRNESYRKAHKEEMKEYDKRYYQEHKGERDRKATEYFKRKRQEALSLLGGKCFFCGKIRRLVFHKKDGKAHGLPAWRAAFKSPKEFVLLCKAPCHRGVHFCMEHLNMTWKDIKSKFNGG